MGFELGRDGPMVILVGIDGSPTSWRAAAYAAGQARRQGARLVLVHVGRPALLAHLAPTEALIELDDCIDEQSAEIERDLAEAVRHTAITPDFRAVRGDPFTELARIADEIRADAVVVGASMQAGHKLVGSLAVRLVRSGRWPVTVVP